MKALVALMLLPLPVHLCFFHQTGLELIQLVSTARGISKHQLVHKLHFLFVSLAQNTVAIIFT